jgi:drug/metabolite transporter (DMT)-like permease
MDGRTDRNLLGVALIVTSVFLLSAVDAAVKAVAADYSLWQIYAVRSAFSVPILLVLLSFGGLGRSLRILRPWVLVRSLVMVVMWLAYYVPLPSIDLSVAATAIYTAPLFIALFSSLFAGEPVGPYRWAGIVLGFVGVLVILRPGADDFSPLALLPVLAGLLYALSAIITRTRCASEEALVLALGLHAGLLVMGIVGSVVIALVEPVPTDRFLLGGWSDMAAKDWLILAGLGVVMVIVAICTARAYQVGAPAVVATFDYSYLVFATLWGILFFSETLDGTTATGIAMIVVAGLFVLRRQQIADSVAPQVAGPVAPPAAKE